jgi:hypothetical protein
MVFNLKKLLNVAVDLTAKGWKEVTQAEWAADFADLGRC